MASNEAFRIAFPKWLDASIRFFLYVLIFWIPYSPAVVEVCVSFGILLWLIKRAWLAFHQKDFKVSNFFHWVKAFQPVSTPLNRWIGYFTLACFLSVAACFVPLVALRGLFSKTLEWFVVYFLVVEVFTERKYFRIFLTIFLVTALSTALDALYQFYISSKDIFLGHPIIPGSRATAGFKTANDLGGFLTILIMLLVGMLFGKAKGWQRAALVFALFISVLAMYVTFTRGAWFSLVIGMIFFFVVYYRKYSRFFFVFFAALVILGVLTLGRGHFLFRPETVFWRQDIWGQVVEMISESPIFGHGPNMFMRIFQEYSLQAKTDPTYAHNCYLQMAAEVGILGLGIFLGIFFLVVTKILKLIIGFEPNSENISHIILGLLSGVLAFMVHSFFDTSLYGLQLSIYFWYVIGVLFSLNKLIDNSTKYGINKS